MVFADKLKISKHFALLMFNAIIIIGLKIIH